MKTFIRTIAPLRLLNLNLTIFKNSSSFRNRKIYPYYFCVVVVADVPFPLLNLLQLICNCFGSGIFTSKIKSIKCSFVCLPCLDAIRCYQCIERSWNDCQQRQKENACNDPTLLGNSHCFSASGKYDNGTAILQVMARGCIDCSGTMIIIKIIYLSVKSNILTLQASKLLIYKASFPPF